MTFKTGAALVLAVAVMAGGCAGPQSQGATAEPEAQGTPLSMAEVRALYAAPHREDGVVLNGAHAGAHWTKWWKPDGSIELSAAHGMFADTGTYAIRGDAVCARWSHIDHGHESCMRIFKSGTDTYTTIDPDGRPGSRFRVRPADTADNADSR